LFSLAECLKLIQDGHTTQAFDVQLTSRSVNCSPCWLSPSQAFHAFQ
jgi:hypothetical protein